LYPRVLGAVERDNNVMVKSRSINFCVIFTLVLVLAYGSRGGSAGDEPVGAVTAAIRTEGIWRIAETPNFRCRCQLSEDDTRRLAECCEVWRSRLRKTWISQSARIDWQPKCEVHVHPDRSAYNRALNRALDTSVGSTMMNFDQGRTVARRIDVRADASDWSNAALPHELTHVVLGERFGGHALPRWADEGIAMLSESPEKHRERLANLREILGRRSALQLAELVQMNRIPPAHQRDAFYGQSAALTSWLVQRSSPARFADFIEDAQSSGISAALKQHYQLDDLVALQRHWDQWVRTPDSVDFVSLQLQIGIVPIIAANDQR
jgi:hypothetical protein